MSASYAVDVRRAIREAAAKATGLSLDELDALAARSPPDAPLPIVPDARRIARGRMQRAGVPERYIRSVADRDPDDCEALDAVKQFLTDCDAWCLILVGGLGVRKTGSACWTLGQREGLFVPADELLGIALRDPARYLAIKRAPLVVLDELGLEQRDDKGYWIGVFSSLMNAWYAACAKVVITGNFAPARLQRRVEEGGYGERVLDRLREHARLVEVGGPSVRGRNS